MRKHKKEKHKRDQNRHVKNKLKCDKEHKNIANKTQKQGKAKKLIM